MAAGGVLGQYLPLNWVIGGSFFLIGLFIFPQLGARGTRQFFAVEDETEAAEPAADSGDQISPE